MPISWDHALVRFIVSFNICGRYVWYIRLIKHNLWVLLLVPIYSNYQELNWIFKCIKLQVCFVNFKISNGHWTQSCKALVGSCHTKKYLKWFDVGLSLVPNVLSLFQVRLLASLCLILLIFFFSIRKSAKNRLTNVAGVLD